VLLTRANLSKQFNSTLAQDGTEADTAPEALDEGDTEVEDDEEESEASEDDEDDDERETDLQGVQNAGNDKKLDVESTAIMEVSCSK
jgi:hypothetical protein